MKTKQSSPTNQPKLSQQQSRQLALKALELVEVKPTSTVSFRSNGIMLIIGATLTDTVKIANQLSDKFTISHLVTTMPKADTDNAVFCGQANNITGYLGNFSIEVEQFKALNPQIKFANKFDLILDLTDKTTAVLPFGWYQITANALSDELVTEINSLFGILDKPKFFSYDANICVHQRNKIHACSRCIDNCAALAITSLGDYVNVNSYLCHGFGSCTTVCPTGAISYSYPPALDLRNKLFTLINTFVSTGGENPKILFYGSESQIPNELAPNILPVVIEEIGCLGLDIFLYVYCLGVSEIFVFYRQETAMIKDEINRQINLASNILTSLGYQQSVPLVKLVNQISAEFNEILPNESLPVISKTIGLIEFDNKREVIFATVDFLYQMATTPRPVECDFALIDDMSSVFFGQIIIDQKLCTLCLACISISVCPMKALTAGDLDKPVVNFQEQLCVQCGLCDKSCPENAIQLQPRLIYNAEQRSQPRVLAKDKPFHCIECDKVFGSTQVIQKMLTSLKNHSMFVGDKLNNLRKCEDCRVKALFSQNDAIFFDV